ncbi:MAG: glycosyltransferase [Candidatus Hydrogenedentales bacterium]
MASTNRAIHMPCGAFIDKASALAQESQGSADRHVARQTTRALHVINGEHYAGAERVQDLLAASLPQFSVETGFACLKPGRFAEMRQTREAPLVELAMRARFDVRPALRLAQIVRRERYELLHTHSPRALLIARVASALSGVPIVHHVHGNTSSEVAGRRFTRLNAWAERKSLPAAAAVIAVSASVADYLRTLGVPAQKLRVVPNGVPTRPRLADRNGLTGDFTLGLVALLRPRKGVETLLEAAALLRDRGLAGKLRIVGRFETNDYEREIHRHAEQLGLDGMIDWRGFQQRVDAELDQMDLLVFPSILPEGMPMVLLEAMAAGVPIVASRVSGITDVVRDRKDGLIFPPGDAAALADAVSELIGNPALQERLRRTAFCRQHEHFSDTSMAAAVADIYHGVLAQKGRRA